MITLHRTDPSRNMARFYTVAVGQDLFGQIWLSRRWGRQGADGQVRYDWFGDEADAMEALKALVRRKRRRGYRMRAGACIPARA